MRPSIMKQDAAVYAALMQVYINHQRQDVYNMAKAMVQEMNDGGIASSLWFLGTFIEALGTRAGTNEEIANVLWDMEPCSSDGHGMKKRECKPDTFFFITALSYFARPTEVDGLLRAHGLLDEMWKTYEETKDKSCKLDMTLYTFLMNAHCQCGSGKQEVKRLVEEVHSWYEQGDLSYAPNHALKRIQQSLLEGVDSNCDTVLQLLK